MWPQHHRALCYHYTSVGDLIENFNLLFLRKQGSSSCLQPGLFPTCFWNNFSKCKSDHIIPTAFWITTRVLHKSSKVQHVLTLALSFSLIFHHFFLPWFFNYVKLSSEPQHTLYTPLRTHSPSTTNSIGFTKCHYSVEGEMGPFLSTTCTLPLIFIDLPD